MIYRLPGVSEVAVIGVPHAHWVEAVLAVVVCRPGQTLSAAEISITAASTWLASRFQGRPVCPDAAQESLGQAAQA